MCVVTVRAGEILLLVCTAQPEHLAFLLVAGQADAVGVRGGQRPLRPKTLVRRVAGGPALMVRAHAMTAHAAGRAAAVQITVGRFENRVNRFIG